MVAGRGRDVLGVAAAEAAAGKMADGKAGEEKPEKPQRAGAAGGEHNPSVAGCVGCSGPFFERPGVGGIGWGRKWADLALTRPGAGPRRDPGTPGAARWDPGPHRLLAGESRPLLVTCCPQRRLCFQWEGRWVPERGIELGVGPGAAVQEPLPPHRRRTSHKTRAHTQEESPSGGRRHWPQAEFPMVLASKLHLGVSLLLPFRWGGVRPRPFLFHFQAQYRPCNGDGSRRWKDRTPLPARWFKMRGLRVRVWLPFF